MAKSVLNYDLRFIDTVSTLSHITPQLIFKKSGEPGNKTIEIKANDISRSLLYTMSAPESYFNFDGTDFALIDYNKFNSYFNTFRPKEVDKAPLLMTEPDEHGEPRFVFINSQITTAEIKQTLANIDVISKPIFETINPGDVDIDFDFTEDQFAEIRKMVSMTDADSAKFTINGDMVTLCLFSSRSADTFVRNYKANITAKKSFAIVCPSTAISQIPFGAYNITIDAEGLVVFNQKREDEIVLTLYVAEK